MKGLIYIFIATFLLLTGCQTLEMESKTDEQSAIYLRAVTESTYNSRTPYEYTVPNDNSEGILHAAIWASSFRTAIDNTYYYTFPNPNPPLNGKNTNHQVAIHATADFDSGHPQLLDQAVYPQSGTPVFFVGLHPQQGWQAKDNNQYAEFEFNGSQDVMFAPRIEGKYASTSTNDNLVFDVPELKFWHLLTWMKVSIIAENSDAITAWGKIKSIKISSKNVVTVDISNEANNGDANLDTQYVAYSSSNPENELLPLWKIGTNSIFPDASGYQLKSYSSTITAPQNVAYVLCSPVIAKDYDIQDGIDVTVPEYTLHIETDTRKITLPIDLRKNNEAYFLGNTRGKYFNINLIFKVGSTVLVSAQIYDWQYGGMGNFEL